LKFFSEKARWPAPASYYKRYGADEVKKDWTAAVSSALWRGSEPN